jgi:hypothetical protein
MKVLSLRIKPHGQEFVATVIGSNQRAFRPEMGEEGPSLIQRVGATEHEAAVAALDALFNDDGPNLKTLVREMVEDAELVDDDTYGYLIGVGHFAALREAVE